MDAFGSVLFTVATVFVVWVLAVWSRGRFLSHAKAWTTSLPVTGGSEPPTHAWSRFHVRYYTMALLFIAFEMEMMFMYPWAVVYVQEGGKALAEMGMFLAILSVGIVYAWREGGLRWQ